MLNPQSSKFWLKLISLFKESGLEVTPIPYQDKKIYFYSSNSEIKDDYVCMVQESSEKKIGDIAGIRLKDSNNQIWKLFIEIKNSSRKEYVNEGMEKFKGDYTNWNSANEGAIFIFLSYSNVSLNQKNLTTAKMKKFFVIDGIDPRDFSLDIKSLSFTGEVSIDTVISKLPFSQIFSSRIN